MQMGGLLSKSFHVKWHGSCIRTVKGLIHLVELRAGSEVKRNSPDVAKEVMIR